MCNLCVNIFGGFRFLGEQKRNVPTTTKDVQENLKSMAKLQAGTKDSPYKCCQPILLLHPFPWFWILCNVRAGVVCYKSARATQSLVLALSNKHLIIKNRYQFPERQHTTNSTDTLKYLKCFQWPSSRTENAFYLHGS